MRTIKPLRCLLVLAALGLATGCLYRLPIQQGNKLNRDLVAQLEPGMTRSQVMFLLGTPMVPNGFNTDRWDYYYYCRYSRGTTSDSSRLTVWFKDEMVDRVESSAETDAAPAVSSAGCY
jgi:outer membrane protein assembly factor BamE